MLKLIWIWLPQAHHDVLHHSHHDEELLDQDQDDNESYFRSYFIYSSHMEITLFLSQYARNFHLYIIQYINHLHTGFPFFYYFPCFSLLRAASFYYFSISLVLAYLRIGLHPSFVLPNLELHPYTISLDLSQSCILLLFLLPFLTL